MRAKRVGTSLLLSFAALEVSTGNIRPGWPITVNVCEVRNRGRNYNPSEAPATAVLRAFDYGGNGTCPIAPGAVKELRLWSAVLRNRGTQGRGGLLYSTRARPNYG